MMKRILSFLAALVMFAACTAAFAEDGTETYDVPVMGMKFTPPQEYGSAKGRIATDGVMELGSGSYYMYFYYSAVPREDYDRMAAEDPGELSFRTSVMFYVFAIGEGKDFSEAEQLTNGYFTAEDATELGREGTYTLYLCWEKGSGFSDDIEAEYIEEYEALCAMKEQTAAGFTCIPAVNEYTGLDGTVIRFEAKDLDGNPVSSEELFSRHAVTMVNIWATWCGPCVGELADLQTVHTHFLEKDCAVVGLLCDDDLDEARRLMEQNGITYDMAVITSSFSFVFPYSSIPTSFYVDRNGVFLGTKFVGAYPADMYESALEPFIGEN